MIYLFKSTSILLSKKEILYAKNDNSKKNNIKQNPFKTKLQKKRKDYKKLKLQKKQEKILN